MKRKEIFEECPSVSGVGRPISVLRVDDFNTDIKWYRIIDERVPHSMMVPEDTMKRLARALSREFGFDEEAQAQNKESEEKPGNLTVFDLRIGDLVCNPRTDGVDEVGSISKGNMLTLGDDLVTIRKVRGAEITEDYLVDLFGFSHYAKSVAGWRKSNVTVLPMGDGVFRVRSLLYSCESSEQYIKYLHELQNYYKQWEGEELKYA